MTELLLYDCVFVIVDNLQHSQQNRFSLTLKIKKNRNILYIFKAWRKYEQPDKLN